MELIKRFKIENDGKVVVVTGGRYNTAVGRVEVMDRWGGFDADDGEGLVGCVVIEGGGRIIWRRSGEGGKAIWVEDEAWRGRHDVGFLRGVKEFCNGRGIGFDEHEDVGRRYETMVRVRCESEVDREDIVSFVGG
eukprot:CAMPEP_0118634488 /NCGR_PEP_ID=MMETSP0785-20121206/1573_1 /TAXON_ID=91992 /ORGANISM="Bolidomonas pacifica, Strain CCMP 1866" /LENGTH=134 /DNA_ID=CAMNT_0006525465 /DNA_START=742 /DNA_END=1142 /DNA_ORIENTATION=-